MAGGLFEGVIDAAVLGVLSQLDGCPAPFAGAGDEWTGVLGEAARVGLLSDLGGGLFRVHPALPVELLGEWERSNPDGFAETHAWMLGLLVEAHAHLGSYLYQQIGSGDANQAFARSPSRPTLLGGCWVTPSTPNNGATLNGSCNPSTSTGTRGACQRRPEDGSTGSNQPPKPPTGTHHHGTNQPAVYGSLLPVPTQTGLGGHISWMPPTRPTTRFAQRSKPAPRHQTVTGTSPSPTTNSARLAQDRGDYDTAQDWYHKSLTINEELGNKPNLATTYHQLGILAQARGTTTPPRTGTTKHSPSTRNSTTNPTSQHLPPARHPRPGPGGLRHRPGLVPQITHHRRGTRQQTRPRHQLSPARHPRPGPGGLRQRPGLVPQITHHLRGAR